MRKFLAIAAFILSTGTAAANCQAPADPRDGSLPFFLGIQPSDGPLDVWCRLQALQGKFRVNVLFPTVQAHKSLEVAFDGQPRRQKQEFATFLQSLLPTAPSPAKDENGMAFPKVLENTVQGLAIKTPDGEPLGLPAGYPRSKAIALWEPVTIRVWPLKIQNVDFTLSIVFRPTIARFLQGLEGHAESMVLKGWHGNVLRDALLDSGCSALIPACKGYGDVIELHTAWALAGISLEARGTGMSGAARTILSEIAGTNRKFVEKSNLKDFDVTFGDGGLVLTDGTRRFQGTAVGDPNRTAGTQAINMYWFERKDVKSSYAATMDAWAKQARDTLILTYQVQ